MTERLESVDTKTEETSELDKVTVRLAAKAMTTVRERAAKKGVSLNEFARQALGTEVYLLEQLDRGARILIERPDKTVSELVLR